MSLDLPLPGSVQSPVFDVGGWAIDQAAVTDNGIDVIHVYAFAGNGAQTFLGVAPVDRTRDDVAQIYGAQHANSGFRLTTPALAPGAYRIIAFAHSTVTNSFTTARSADITVRTPGNPVMTIDTPSAGASTGQPFAVAGWAIDRDATSGTGVDAIHVWAYPSSGSAIFLGTAQLGAARNDVGGIYGAQFTNSGYNLAVSGLAPGQYQIVVFAHSTVTGTFNQSRVVAITVF
jgi:hypothetical protein